MSGLRASAGDPAQAEPAPRLGVSIDVSAVPADPVGAGWYVIELVRALGRRDDVATVLLTRAGDAERWKRLAPAASVLARAPAARPLRVAWEHLALGALTSRLDGVEVHHGPHYSMPLRPGVPCVVTVHDCTLLDHPEWHERSKVALFGRAIRQAARGAAVVVCPSEMTAERFRALCRPAAEVRVVPHGIDHHRFSPGEPEHGADAARLAALGVRRPFLLHVGTLEPRKDVATLVRAFAILATRPSGADLQLVLAGLPGWGSATVEEAIAALAEPVRRRLLRTGYVASEDVPALLRNTEASVYASIEEGVGLPAAEALACGAPLVTSRGSVMAELAGEAALLVETGDPGGLADALDVALAGGAAASLRRQAGFARTAGLSWAACADGHLAAYRLAAARGRAGRRRAG